MTDTEIKQKIEIGLADQLHIWFLGLSRLDQYNTKTVNKLIQDINLYRKEVNPDSRVLTYNTFGNWHRGLTPIPSIYKDWLIKYLENYRP